MGGTGPENRSSRKRWGFDSSALRQFYRSRMYCSICAGAQASHHLTQGGRLGTRWSHKPEQAGATPAPATICLSMLAKDAALSVKQKPSGWRGSLPRWGTMRI